MVKNSNLVCHFSFWWIKVSAPHFGLKYDNLHSNCTAFLVFFFLNLAEKIVLNMLFNTLLNVKPDNTERRRRRKKKEWPSWLYSQLIAYQFINPTGHGFKLEWLLLKNRVLWGLNCEICFVVTCWIFESSDYTKKTFTWDKYLAICRAPFAPPHLFRVSVINPLVPIVIKINFLLTISIHCQQISYEN